MQIEIKKVINICQIVYIILKFKNKFAIFKLWIIITTHWNWSIAIQILIFQIKINKDSLKYVNS